MPNFDLDGGTSGGKVGYKERCRYVIKRIGLRGVEDMFYQFLSYIWDHRNYLCIGAYVALMLL